MNEKTIIENTKWNITNKLNAVLDNSDIEIKLSFAKAISNDALFLVKQLEELHKNE